MGAQMEVRAQARTKQSAGSRRRARAAYLQLACEEKYDGLTQENRLDLGFVDCFRECR